MKAFRRNLLMGFLLIFAALGVFFGCASSNKVTFKFVTNGGAPIEAVKVEKGETYPLPTPVYDEAHEFEGWYDNAEFTGSKVSSVVAESNKTFYAKWTDLSKITIVNGGNLPAALYLKAGANVYDFMQEHVPVLDGDHQFAAWHVGEKELSRNTVMPAEGITLTASYKVKFTGHTFLQTSDGQSYEPGEDYVGFGFEGELPEFDLEGFTLNADHEGATALRALGANASDNVFEVYFDRKQATILLFANYPEGTSPSAERLTVPFGTKVKLPTDLFTVNGYCLTGWSTSVSDEAEYPSAYLYDRLFNKDGVEAPAEFSVESETVSLYAVWKKGSVDMFGGSDIVYHFNQSDPYVYVYRNGVFLKTVYRENRPSEDEAEGSASPVTYEFFLMSESGTVLVQGRLNRDGTYSYFNRSRIGTYTLYENRELDSSVQLTVDGYNGMEFRQKTDPTHTDTSYGTYVIVNNEDFSGYVATFTTGLLTGKTLYLRVGYIEGENGAQINAFQVRNEEDASLGILYRFVDPDRYYPSVYQVLLNGFGTAAMNMGSSTSSFYYEREDEVINLYDARDELVYELHLAQQNGRNGYYLYQPEFAHTFTSADGTELELDGFYGGVLREGGSRATGNYLITSTRLNGYLVDFTADGVTRRFRIDTVENAAEEGADPTYTYTLEKISDGYAEYLYSNGENAYYIPLLVLDDGGAGKASLYGYPGTQVYTKFADGTYLFDKDTNLYAFTVGNYYDVENMSTGFGADIDVSLLESFVFGTVSTSPQVYYLYSVTLKGQAATEYSEVYSKGEDTLTLVASFCFYKTGKDVLMGTYSRVQSMENVLQFTPSDGGSNRYFELDEDGKTFEELTDFLGTVYNMNAAGSTVRTSYLVFDGKGGAVYHDTTADLVAEGTYQTAEGKTLLGDSYFTFRSSDGGTEFSFQLYSTSSSVVFVRYNEAAAKSYTSDLGEILVLDGFATAQYTYSGQSVSGIYVTQEDGTIRLTIAVGQSGSTYYVDLLEEDHFSVRGFEYTSRCLWYDNQTRQDVYFALDGYGKLIAYDKDGNPIDENGSYEEIGDGRYLFTYTDEAGEKVPIYGVFGTANVGGITYLAIIVEHNGIVGTYVDENTYTVLSLDAYGGAVYYDNTGVATSASYILVSEDMLYFTSGSDACIYLYDTSRGVATRTTFQAYGYYTKDLEALNFSEYGYVSIEGELCYFRVERGQVILYRAPREGEKANEYGFVEDRTFGTFSSQKEFNGKTYFLSDGYSIKFVRAAENADKYPILAEVDEEKGEIYAPLGELTFGPRGGGQFSVSGRVDLGEYSSANDNCTVVRNILEDGTAELYLRINAKVGYYRFDFTIEYYGDNAALGANVYTITGMKYITELPSYNYIYYNYLYNMLSGGLIGVENVFGTLTITKPCGEDGVVSDEGTLDLEFGSAFPIADYEGNLISLSEVSDFTEVSDANYNYEVTFTSKDSYTYVLRLSRRFFYYTQSYGFSVYSLTRLQTFDNVTVDGEAGKLEVERVIFSELTGVQPGNIWEIRLYKGETLLEYEGYSFTSPDGKFQYIVCEHAEDEAGTITSATFYHITLTEKIPEEVDEESQNVVQPYTGVSVESETMKTAYTADGNGFAHITDDGKIVIFIIGRTYYIVQDCTYSAEDRTYDLTTTSGRTYHVTTDEEGKLTFEETTSPAE